MQIFTANNEEIAALTLSEEESKHCIRVLRKKVGDTINITNGLGKLIVAKITSASAKGCEFTITDEQFIAKTSAPLHIAIAPTKNIDRFEFFLEKATEIGIKTITPILCERSERKVLKPERLQKLLTSASKQSKNFHFPVLNPLIGFQEFIKDDLAKEKFIAHCLENEKKSLNDFIIQSPTTILVGPEGDFSKNEIESALANNYKPVTLGNTRLRTETAGIVASTIINLNFQTK